MGHELSAGDSSCRIAAILEGCRRAGKASGAQIRDAFSAIKMGEESMAHIKLL